MIDRDWFSQSEWNSSRLIKIPFLSIYGNRYLTVLRECEEEVPEEKPCDEVIFETTIGVNREDQAIEIDLQFNVVRSAEELPSSLRMALDLLGIQSILFSFTLLQLFWLVYQFTKSRWRWKLKNKTDKVVWFIVCLLFSLGCSWNTIRMLDMIVNGELVPIEHYELAKRVQMPAVVFCLRIDQTLIDRNRPLTGRYLEELTGNITTERIFESIVYLNESEWITFDLNQVERFFLLDMKCFRVDVNKWYNRNQFHFSDDTQVLKANFNNVEENLFIHFMTQSKETEELSNISNLIYSWYLWSARPVYKHVYAITHESSLYVYEDRFRFFRRRFPSLQDGDVGDLRRHLLKLQANEPNRRTLKLPLKEEHFSVEVDEKHFEQLYLAQTKKNRNKWTNLNYRQTFVTNHLRKDWNWVSSSEPLFSFQLLFLQRVVHSTNEVNYATLTLALLSLLSLWLELGVLDLRPFLVRLHDLLLVPLYLHLPVLFLRKITKALLFCCKCLKKLKPLS